MRTRFSVVETTNDEKTRTTVSVEDTEYPQERIALGFYVKSDSPDKLLRMQNRAAIITRALNSEVKAIKR
jgi:hypothetical protein